MRAEGGNLKGKKNERVVWTQLRDEILPTSGPLTHSRELLSPGSRQELGLGRMLSITKGLFSISIVLGAIPGTRDTAVNQIQGMGKGA